MNTIGSHIPLGSLFIITVINNNPIQTAASLIGDAESSTGVTCSDDEIISTYITMRKGDSKHSTVSAVTITWRRSSL